MSDEPDYENAIEVALDKLPIHLEEHLQDFINGEYDYWIRAIADAGMDR